MSLKRTELIQVKVSPRERIKLMGMVNLLNHKSLSHLIITAIHSYIKIQTGVDYDELLEGRSYNKGYNCNKK